MQPSWSAAIEAESSKAYFKQLQQFVQSERDSGKSIFPPQSQVLSAFDVTPLDKVKVVILGQDPYHGEGQAHGLSFSVQPGVAIPPSLRNMYKELAQDIDGFEAPSHGYLLEWAKQGVLLLNTVLTVEQAQAHSHAKKGWETFTDAMLCYLNQHTSGVVFLLWGAHAQKKAQLIDAQKHHVLAAPHPSPLSARRGFFGCGHFSKANQILSSQNETEIDWRIDEIE